MLGGFTPEEIDAFESMLDRIEKNGLELQRQSEQATIQFFELLQVVHWDGPVRNT